MGVSIEGQIGWASHSALVVAADERCVLEVTGQDRLTWLNGLLTCELAKRRPGEAVPGLAVAQKGKIVSDVVVVVGEDRVWVVVQRAAAAALVASFEHHLMMEDAELRASTLETRFVHGPASLVVLDAARAAGAVGGPLDVTGAGGAVVLAAPRSEAWGALERAASQAGGGVGDAEGWRAVRVRAAVPQFGVDFDEATYPQEASLETKSVSFDKGCYLGQEVVCMLEMRGHVKRKLVPIAIESDVVPPARAAVEDGNGAVVGEVTSAVATGTGELRALAMIKYAFIAPSTRLRVDGHPARVL